MTMKPGDALDGAQWDAVEEATELIQEGQFQNALYVLREVVRADGRNPYAFYFMGVALYELGQLEPARDAYRAAVVLAPSYVGARGSLAQVLRRLGDNRAAIREAREALHLRADDPDALHAAGMAHAALDQRSEARRYLEAFLRTKPELEAAQEARLSLATLDRGQGPIDIDLALVADDLGLGEQGVGAAVAVAEGGGEHEQGRLLLGGELAVDADGADGQLQGGRALGGLAQDVGQHGDAAGDAVVGEHLLVGAKQLVDGLVGGLALREVDDDLDEVGHLGRLGLLVGGQHQPDGVHHRGHLLGRQLAGVSAGRLRHVRSRA